MPGRAGSARGGITPKSKSFRFTPDDLAKMERARVLMGCISEAEMLRILVADYIALREGTAARDATIGAVVARELDARLPGLVEHLLRQLGPAVLAEALVAVAARRTSG
jgi:hypothetical protein